MVTLRELSAKLDRCLAALAGLTAKGDEMAGELAALQAQVVKTQEAEAAAILLIRQLAQQLADLIANGATPAQLLEVTTALDNSAKALAAEVAANTPTLP